VKEDEITSIWGIKNDSLGVLKNKTPLIIGESENHGI